jgi:hypothetical protein
LNVTHQLLVFVDDINILDENINIIKENTEGLVEQCGEVGPDVNTEKIKYTVMSCQQNLLHNHNLLIANKGKVFPVLN